MKPPLSSAQKHPIRTKGRQEALETDSVIDTTESITQKKLFRWNRCLKLKKKKKLLTQMIQGSNNLTEGRFKEKKKKE